MSKRISKAYSPREQRLAVGKPQTPPLDIPPGGGVVNSPYADFDVASEDKWAFDWDEKTRRLVRERVEHVPPYRFFSEKEIAILEALCARALPQADRAPQDRIPIAPWIDERLYKNQGSGYRYDDMPDDRTAYHLALEGFDQTAIQLFHASLIELTPAQQDEVMQCVADGDTPGENWKLLPARKFFQEFIGDVISNYYAHPAAWAEMGFNGPSSPRGHIRLGFKRADPWEAKEQRPRSSVEIVQRHRERGGGEGAAKGGATH